MLRMDQVHIIRHQVLVEGQSQRQVAEKHGISRNTVRKYISESEPCRRQQAPRGRPVLERVRDRLDQLLEEWDQRTTSKQRLTARRLHAQLVQEGYQVGESTVRGYVREWKRERAETFVPLVHRAGDEAQVDFFEVTVELDGQRCKRWMLLVRLMYSGRDFAWLYEHCDQVSFLDGHVRAFAHFGGVPSRLVYDNLSAAVRRVLFPARQLTTRFMALASHYLFEPCFARPGTGHDKGGVEGRGKGIRWQHLVPIPQGDSIGALSEQLLKRLDEQAETKRDEQGRTVTERFREDATALRPLPERPFEPRMVETLVVSGKALVRHAGATYSVPSHWKMLDATAYVGPQDIRFVCCGEVVERRRVSAKTKNIQYRDYLKELRHKPQATRQVAPELISELGEPFGQLWRLLEQTHGGREAGRVLSKVLGAVVDHGEQEVARALCDALENGERNLLALAALKHEPPKQLEDIPEPLRQYVIEAASAADFDVLLDRKSVV